MSARLSITAVNTSKESTQIPADLSDSYNSDGSIGSGGDPAPGAGATGKTYSFQTAGIIKGDYSKDYGDSYNAIYIDIEMAKKLLKEYNT